MRKSIALFTAFVMLMIMAFSAMPASATDQKTLASFIYTGGIAKTDVEGDKNEGYVFSSMIPGVDARLFASVSGDAVRKLEWTDAVYAYGLGEELMPCMTGGNKNPWGSNPYFLVKLSTSGYSDIHFSAKLGGSKKGPANYKLQYSLNGTDFHDVPGANYEITGKVMRTAFNVSIPEISDAETAYIRIIASSSKCVDTSNPDFPGTTGGETAINDIVITGTSLSSDSVIPPTLSAADGSTLCSDDTVTVTDLNGGGAQVKYSVTGDDGNTVTYDYTGSFAPFVAASGDTVKVEAWTVMGGDSSARVSAEYKFGGDKLAVFSCREEVSNSNQKAAADSGKYKDVSFLSASVNGSEGFVPLFDKNNGFALSPDDGIVWGNGCWMLETSTAGYSDIAVSLSALSTGKGPASADLQYSLDGANFITVNRNISLSDLTKLDFYKLPAAAANRAKLYIRLYISEDKRVDGEKLFDNESKGNTYVNNILISGKASGAAMPYAAIGDFAYIGQTVKLISPDGKDITYSVTDIKGNTVVADTAYTAPFALPDTAGRYIITAFSGDGPAFTKTVTVSDGIMAQFSYTAENFDTCLDTETGVLKSQSGDGTLSMYPNGETAVTPVFDEAYGVKASAAETNTWAFSGNAGDSAGSGYWLVTFSTKGYKHISLSADTTGSSKGPRDFALVYSLDGTNYTYIQNSGIRNTGELFDTYAGFALPEELSDADTVYLKIFINGGETLEGKEFIETAGSGHTGINNITVMGTTLDTDDEPVDPPEPVVIKGDVDDNGIVNVSDIISLKTLIMSNSWNEGQLLRGDMDDNKTLNVSDMLSIKNLIMAGG